MKNLLYILFLTALPYVSFSQENATFENLTLPPDTFWNGSTDSLGTSFSSGNFTFQNYYDTAFGGYWASGWAYSNVFDTTTAGFTNLYGAITGTDVSDTGIYAVGQQHAGIKLNSSGGGVITYFDSIRITNSTYAYLSMRDGDAIGKKFGGPTGNDPDFFKIVINGYDKDVMVNDSIEVYLADFRDSNNANDFILNDWQKVDLSSLNNDDRIDSISFTLRSSDIGQFGINTPLFFCIDNIKIDVVGTVRKNWDKEPSFTIFPNPAKKEVFISGNYSEHIPFELFTLNGAFISKHWLIEGDNHISIENLKPGTYLLKQGIKTQRLIKK